jgi:hypothetical protein
MKIMQNNRNSAAATVRYNRAKMVAPKLAQQLVTILIKTATLGCKLLNLFKPNTTTRLLFTKKLHTKRFTFIDRNNTIQIALHHSRFTEG